MTEQQQNPYSAKSLDVPATPGNVKSRFAIAFFAVLIPMMIIPHSSGTSSRSVGGVNTRSSFQAYGLPKWLTLSETNGTPDWTFHPLNFVLMVIITATAAAGFARVTSRLNRPQQHRNHEARS